MTIQDMGKWNYRRKAYTILACYAELTIPVLAKYQMVKADGTIYKEISPVRAEEMMAKGEFTKYQQFTTT